MKRTPLTAFGALLVALVLATSACGSSRSTGAPTGGPGSTGASGELIQLVYWYWGEADAPGADAWMAETVAAYEKIHSNVTIKVVPQSTDTLISAIQTAIASKSGPDIATQWATGPVMSAVWQDAVLSISDLLPADEVKHWLGTDENTWNGKLWAMPMYLIGTHLAYNKEMFAQAGVTPPSNDRWTLDEFSAACAKLKAAGITPVVLGNKDGYAGGWWLSYIGGGQLNSQFDMVAADVGKASFDDPKYTGWYAELEKLIQAGYFNSDVMSWDLSQEGDLLAQKKGAMSFATDGVIKYWMDQLGADNVGVMRPPTYGTGAVSDWGNTTQSTSQFVLSWSQHPQEAADFLQFMHTPDSLTSWYQHTGAIPADDRFDTSLITSPQLQKTYTWQTTGSQVWLENWLPVQVDGNGAIAASQIMFSGGSATEAAALWETAAKAWRAQHPDEVANWSTFLK